MWLDSKCVGPCRWSEEVRFDFTRAAPSMYLASPAPSAGQCGLCGALLYAYHPQS